MPISWGPSEPYGTGNSNAVARDSQGHVVEVHVGSAGCSTVSGILRSSVRALPSVNRVSAAE